MAKWNRFFKSEEEMLFTLNSIDFSDQLLVSQSGLLFLQSLQSAYFINGLLTSQQMKSLKYNADKLYIISQFHKHN